LSLLEDSDFFFLLRHRAESIEALKENKRVMLSEGTCRQAGEEIPLFGYLFPVFRQARGLRPACPRLPDGQG